MTMAKVFTNRYEIKYLLPAERVPMVRKVFGDLLEPDPFNVDEQGYYNYSVYFDTLRNRFYLEKHEGMTDRVKPRIRIYRHTLDGPPVKIFLEFKEKHDRIVKKQRQEISATLAGSMLDGKGLGDEARWRDQPVLKRFYALEKKYGLQPRLTVCYRRCAYFSPFYPRVRLTFDLGVRGSLITRMHSFSRMFSYTLPPMVAMMELKYDHQLPRMIIRKLEELELNQVTFSKYAVSLETCLQEVRSRGVARYPMSSRSRHLFFG